MDLMSEANSYSIKNFLTERKNGESSLSLEFTFPNKNLTIRTSFPFVSIDDLNIKSFIVKFNIVDNKEQKYIFNASKNYFTFLDNPIRYLKNEKRIKEFFNSIIKYYETLKKLEDKISYKILFIKIEDFIEYSQKYSEEKLFGLVTLRSFLYSETINNNNIEKIYKLYSDINNYNLSKNGIKSFGNLDNFLRTLKFKSFDLFEKGNIDFWLNVLDFLFIGVYSEEVTFKNYFDGARKKKDNTLLEKYDQIGINNLNITLLSVIFRYDKNSEIVIDNKKTTIKEIFYNFTQIDFFKLLMFPGEFNEIIQKNVFDYTDFNKNNELKTFIKYYSILTSKNREITNDIFHKTNDSYFLESILDISPTKNLNDEFDVYMKEVIGAGSLSKIDWYSEIYSKFILKFDKTIKDNNNVGNFVARFLFSNFSVEEAMNKLMEVAKLPKDRLNRQEIIQGILVWVNTSKDLPIEIASKVYIGDDYEIF